MAKCERGRKEAYIVVAELKDDVDIVNVFKVSLKAHNVGMAQVSMYSNLALKLHFISRQHSEHQLRLKKA